jgi:hypothetical protein
MKKLVVLVCLVFCFGFVVAEEFRVNQGGTGGARSVEWFNTPGSWEENGGEIGPGDIIYFEGTINDEVSVHGSGTPGNPIILDGYQGGECSPKIKQPCPGVTIDRNHEGRNYYYGIYIDNQDYIEVRDFNIIDGSHGIVIRGEDSTEVDAETSDHILIRDNYLADLGGRGIGSGNHWRRESPHVTVSTTYLTVGGARGDGNVFYNIAYMDSGSASSCITLSYSKDTVISYNTFYNDYSPLVVNGCDAIVTIPNTERLLIEYNSFYGMGEDALDLKGAAQDTIVRFNKADRIFQAAWQIHSLSDNTYVYGNLAEGTWLPTDSKPDGKGNWAGLMVYRSPDNVFFWSNIAYDWDSAGFNSNSDWDNDDPERAKPSSNINVWGNTLAYNNDDGKYSAGFSALDPTSSFSRNNIIYKNSMEAQNNLQMAVNPGVVSGADYDYDMFWTGGDFGMAYEIKSSGVTDFDGFVSETGLEQNAIIVDPLFENPEGRDFRLKEGSPAIDDACVEVKVSDLENWDPPTIQGVDYSLEVTPDLALGPGTDWSQTPPVVEVVSQDDFGDGWECGAYVYGERVCLGFSDVVDAVEDWKVNGDVGALLLVVEGWRNC